MQLVERSQPKLKSNGTLYLTPSHLVFADANTKQEIWVSLLKRKKRRNKKTTLLLLFKNLDLLFVDLVGRKTTTQHIRLASSRQMQTLSDVFVRRRQGTRLPDDSFDSFAIL